MKPSIWQTGIKEICDQIKIIGTSVAFNKEKL